MYKYLSDKLNVMYEHVSDRKFCFKQTVGFIVIHSGSGLHSYVKKNS